MINRDKFACPCCGRNWIDHRVVAKIREIEDDVGERLHVTSGYRCERHNKEVGGSTTSSHLKGLAADIRCEGSRSRYRITGAAIKAGITRIGIGNGFIHIDMDRAKSPRVIWLYRGMVCVDNASASNVSALFMEGEEIVFNHSGDMAEVCNLLQRLRA